VARILHLDAQFRLFVQGDLSVNDYCRKMKWMADNLHDLDEHVEDRTLVLDVLRGLNKKYDHVKTYPKQVPSFPSFHDICNDLLLEELTLDADATSGSTTALAASGERQQRPSPTPRPPWWSSIPNSPGASGGGCGGDGGTTTPTTGQGRGGTP
jgi:hypothetical protein